MDDAGGYMIKLNMVSEIGPKGGMDLMTFKGGGNDRPGIH